MVWWWEGGRNEEKEEKGKKKKKKRKKKDNKHSFRERKGLVVRQSMESNTDLKKFIIFKKSRFVLLGFELFAVAANGSDGLFNLEGGRGGGVVRREGREVY